MIYASMCHFQFFGRLGAPTPIVTHMAPSGNSRLCYQRMMHVSMCQFRFFGPGGMRDDGYGWVNSGPRPPGEMSCPTPRVVPAHLAKCACPIIPWVVPAHLAKCACPIIRRVILASSTQCPRATRRHFMFQSDPKVTQNYLKCDPKSDPKNNPKKGPKVTQNRPQRKTKNEAKG